MERGPEQKPVSEPVQKDLPQDDLSRAIRALVLAGISRNKVIELLSLGSKAPALKRIKEALGEVIEEPELKKAA